jgi:hypothetical protein
MIIAEQDFSEWKADNSFFINLFMEGIMKNQFKLFYMFVILICLFLFITGCKPVISQNCNNYTILSGEKKVIGSFAIKNGYVAMQFNKIRNISYEKDIFHNVMIVKKDDNTSYPIENFFFDIPAQQTIDFDILADAQTYVAKESSVSIGDFEFKQIISRKIIKLTNKMDFNIKLKIRGLWEKYTLGTKSTSDLAQAVSINNYGKAFVLSGVFYNDDNNALSVYSYDPDYGWNMIGEITLNDGLKPVSVYRIFIDDKGDGLIIWEDSYYDFHLYAKRIINNKLSTDTIKIDTIYGSPFSISTTVKMDSNSSGDICITINDSSVHSLSAHRISTQDEKVSKTVLDREFYSGSNLTTSVSENGDIICAWIEDNNKICAKLFTEGGWSQSSLTIYETEKTSIISELNMDNDNGNISFVWVEKNQKNNEIRILNSKMKYDNEQLNPETVYLSTAELYNPIIKGFNNNQIIVFIMADGYLYASNNLGLNWGQPIKISHGSLCSPLIDLFALKNGDFTAGYITSEVDKEYLNTTYYDSELGWLSSERISSDFYYCINCLPKWTTLPLAISESGQAITLWYDEDYKDIIVGLYK